MVTIQYEIDGKLVDIEVTEEVAQAYQSILDDEKRVFERDKKRAESSLDLMEDAGFQFADSSSNVEDIAIFTEDHEKLMSAIKTLLPEQQELVVRIYFNGERQIDIANEQGVDKSAIARRIERILARLKKVLN